jgi:GNAT superfamily N-acetyltransferase
LSEVLRIRDAVAEEALVLEALQRRSSDIWEEYRVQLAANPDAIVLSQTFVDNGWVRVAVAGDLPIGFSVVIPGDDAVHELDGLFVERARMYSGVGRALVEDAAGRALAAGASTPPSAAGPTPRPAARSR